MNYEIWKEEIIFMKIYMDNNMLRIILLLNYRN